MTKFNYDATYYAQTVKNRESSVIDLVDAAISNIEASNDLLNAVVHTQFDDARETAEEFDDYLKSNPSNLPPFFGVPILLKDLGQSQAGQRTTNGAKLMDNFVSNVTDNFTKGIEGAGFIVIGRTNVPEFGFKNNSDSQWTGRVNSPIDADRNPGGSSGGAAAALKAGIVPIVTASDGGGSIRIPASFSGLIGLKPSRGRVPVGPEGYRGWQGASVNFALTKSVRDTWSLLKWMQTEQLEAPFIMPRIQQEELTKLKSPLRIAYSMNPPEGSELTAEARDMMEHTINILTALGHSVKEDEPQIDGIEAMRTYYKVNGVETASMMAGFEGGLNRQLSPDDMELMTWAIYQMGRKITGVEYSNVLSHWDQMTATTEEFFSDYDLLLMPTTNGPAPLHTAFEKSDDLQKDLKNIAQFDSEKQQGIVWQMFAESLAWTPFTQQMNLTGQPAISLPMYKIKDSSLPLGAQFSTKKGGEYLLLQLALQLENEGYLDTEIVE